MKLSIPQLALRVQTEADAYKFLEDLRWGDRPACPHCGSVDPYYLTPKDGVSRKTTRGPRSQRRVWKCRACRKQFSVLTGTIFHGTKIPVRTWVFVVFEMCASKNGVSAREIERKYDLTPKTAWFMCHRIREAMKREPMSSLLSGRVVSDETWFGGKPSNRHVGQRTKRDHRIGGTKKTPIISLISKETGEVRSTAVPTVNAENLRAVLQRNVEPAQTHLHSDMNRVYRFGTLYGVVSRHSTVDHSIGEYVSGDVSTNQAENYFSQLKRSIDGTHHHVSVEHLPRYLAEFDFRYSTRHSTDTERMGKLMERVGGRRLTYRQPGKA
jgi:transposase-like protein